MPTLNSLTIAERGSARNEGADLAEFADVCRVEACRTISDAHRSKFGQFLTSPDVSRLMASLFRCVPRAIHLLDAGAGVGMLTAAFIERVLQQKSKPERIEITAFEIEPAFKQHLEHVMDKCVAVCMQAGIQCSFQIETRDFIGAATAVASGPNFFERGLGPFTHAILNPPYSKLNTGSRERQLLRSAAIETSNFYAAFIWLSAKLLENDGEMVWISPRSFCNGPYFLPFRKYFLAELALRDAHVFDSRDTAFSHDDVLQENVIVSAVKSKERPRTFTVHSSSSGAEHDDATSREVDYTELVDPRDQQSCFHLVPNALGSRIKTQIEKLPNSLQEIGINVSTGRVVDFRAVPWLRPAPTNNTVPLIYPRNFCNGAVAWPLPDSKKPSAIVDCPDSRSTLIANGVYVLVKRFSSKEERRRVVAAVYDPRALSAKFRHVGFENHVNYFHADEAELPLDLARGLCVFLNSTLVDEYFRQFNGHTQVNAFDLRKLRYPSREALESLGGRAPERLDDQTAIDTLLEMEPDFMPETSEPIAAKKKIEEALKILKALDVPRQQQNERSALTLLALADLKPAATWAAARSPLRGISEMMDFFRDNYGKNYKENSRESVRRQTVHQFTQIGLLIENPDEPGRPKNSQYWSYQLEASALSLLRKFGTESWAEALQNYVENAKQLRCLQAKEREMAMLPVTLPDGKTLQLSQGGQNLLIKKIVEEFCSRFTPGAVVLYVGDAGKKFLVNETQRLSELGIEINEHGKMPDIVVHYRKMDWLVLIEAVTTHGPVNIKRHNELKALFARSTAGLVFVTAFPSRKEMNKYLGEIAWETEVWVADAPSHLIHFNGERFLGPHEQPPA
jgi:adenine-specific DNA-methyltransferase